MQESTTDSPNNIEKINLMPMDAGVNNATPAKHKKIGIIIAVILVTIIAIAGVVTAIILFRFNRSFTHGSPYKHSSYFIPESTDRTTKYALFDKEGNNLTDFTIKSYNSFVDGYALVRTMDGWSIIGEDGKPSVEVGEYDGITRVGGLYSAFKAGAGKHMLIHGSGRIVTEFNTEQNPKLTDLSYDGKNALAVAIHREDDKYDIYNAHGEFVRQINSSEAPTVSYYSDGEVETSSTVISYNGGMIILANQDLSEVANVSTPNKYSVRDMSSDHKLVVLYRTEEEKKETSSGSSPIIYDEDDYEDIAPYPTYSSKSKYALINNGNYYDLEDQCQSISITNSSNDNTGYAYCSTKKGSGFIDASNVFHLMGTNYSDNERYYVIDGSHYALFDMRKRTATIDNDIIEHVNSVGVIGSHYTITTNGDTQTIYDKNGKKLCKLPGDVSYLTGFKRNGVSIARKSTTYKTSTVDEKVVRSSSYKEVLINRDCNVISEQYDHISEIGDYYQAIKYDDATNRSYSSRGNALLDKEGKIRIDFGKYNSFSTVRYGAEHSMITAYKSDGKTDLLSENLDVIDEVSSHPSFDVAQNIYKVTTEKFIKYITPEGTVIYSIPRGNGARSEV